MDPQATNNETSATCEQKLFPNIVRKQDVIAGVKAMFNNKKVNIHLYIVTGTKYQKKSSIYSKQHMICNVLPQITCGWPICSQVLTENCQMKDSLKPYNTTSGMTVFHRHVDMIIHAAAHAFILGSSPFSFC